jgi:hypothetical protein
MTLDHIVATVNSDTIVAFDTTAEFIIPSVAVLTSSPLMWRKEEFYILKTTVESHHTWGLCSKDGA